MAFGRKKIEKPKSILGYALFRFDQILNIKLKGIIHAARLKKRINPRTAAAIADDAGFVLETILEDISKENLKTDYRSDKIRDVIIIMIGNLKDFLKELKEQSLKTVSVPSDVNISSIDEIYEKRQSLKKKLKDIESDYV